MATYKLIQDVEAEDHILGPLTLRQFIFALISIFCLYMSFIFYTKHVAFLLIILLPPALFFGFFAIPFGRDQPTEVWALAKIRFYLKPRVRVWDQSGVKELVTITVPKKIERVLTDGLSPYEVQSRLSALASTLDSRGWAIKNAAISSGSQPIYSGLNDLNTDRLIDTSALPVVVEDINEPDVLDENNSPISRQFEQMIDQTSQAKRKELIERMNAKPIPQSSTQPINQPQPLQPQQSSTNNQWFMPHIDPSNNKKNVTAPEISAQDETPDELALASALKAQRSSQQAYAGNLRTIQPLGSAPAGANPTTNQGPQTAADDSSLTTPQKDPAIISLANNDDLSVSTIAHVAKKAKKAELTDGEVVISLH